MEVEYDTEIQESGQSLPINTVINGNAYSGFVAGNRYAQFRAAVVTDVAGSLRVQQSPDGINWYTSQSQATLADATQLTIIASIWTLPFVRCQLVTGTGTTTVVRLFSELVIGDV